MTKLLDRAIRAVQELPSDAQDEIASLLLALAGEDLPPVDLSPEEEALLSESLEQAARGEFASDEEVRALWAKYGL